MSIEKVWRCQGIKQCFLKINFALRNLILPSCRGQLFLNRCFQMFIKKYYCLLIRDNSMLRASKETFRFYLQKNIYKDRLVG